MHSRMYYEVFLSNVSSLNRKKNHFLASSIYLDIFFDLGVVKKLLEHISVLGFNKWYFLDDRSAIASPNTSTVSNLNDLQEARYINLSWWMQ